MTPGVPRPIRRLAGLFAVGVALVPGAAEAATSADLIALYDAASTRSVDTARSADAAGRTLDRPGLSLRFERGDFLPLQRGDGRTVGVVFVGQGTATFAPGDEVERGTLVAGLPSAAQAVSFGQGWFLATDDALESLLGESPAWRDGASPAAAAATSLVSARSRQLADPRWERTRPDLEFDVLEDLHGAGFVGGHVFAEVDLSPGGWVSYYHNPRGSLLRGDTATIFTHASRGSAPHDVKVLASWPAPGAAPEPAYDLVSVDVDLTARAKGMDRDLSMVTLSVQEKFTSTSDEPVRALTLDLYDGVRRCIGDDDFGSLRLTRARDYADREPGILHRRGRLFVSLNAPLHRGELEVLRLEYSGNLIQPVASGAGNNAFFTPLGAAAWYPRPARPDRHAFAITFHTDRFVRGIATGELVSDQEEGEKKGRTMRYEEKGGVLAANAVVGEYIVFESDPADGAPRIRFFTTDSGRQSASQLLGDERKLLRALEALWGPYPYSALNLVDLLPMPAGNWKFSAQGAASNTQGGWTCSPPSERWSWEGFAASTTGAMSIHLPATAPTTDRVQASTLDRLWTQNPNALLMYQAVRLARQWWAQMIGPASYRDQWLTEAIAEWSALLVLQKAKGDKAFDDRLATFRELAKVEEGAGPLVVGERLGEDYAGVTWGRGGALVAMLAHQVGVGPFVHGVQSLLGRPSPKGLTTAALLDSLPGGAAKLQPIVDAWARTGGLPILEHRSEIKAEEGGTHEVSGVFRLDPHVPGLKVPVVLRMKKGDRHEVVELTGPETPFTFQGIETRPTRVEVDPERTLLLKDVRPLARSGGG